MIKEKLEANLTPDSLFKGFSPRWTLPVKVRNITDPTLHTSIMLLIIDSKREAELKFGAGFTDERMGDYEVMISTHTMKYLNVSAIDKDKIDLYFDFMQLMRTVYSVTDGDFGSTGDSADTNVFNLNATDVVKNIDRDVNKEINEALR